MSSNRDHIERATAEQAAKANGRRVDVLGCPCEQMHSMSVVAWNAFVRVTEGRPLDAVEVMVGKGARFRVPRVYVACHGLRAEELPALAQRYGWEVQPD